MGGTRPFVYARLPLSLAMRQPIAQLGTVLHLLGQRGLDLLLPAQCLSCRELTGEPRRLCAKCFNDAHLLAEPLCRVCGIPLPGTNMLSGRAQLDLACGKCL